MDQFLEWGYWGLFMASFLAATVLPLSSEVVLTGLLLNDFSPRLLVVTATMGNVLGSITNYALGFWAATPVIKKWLRLSDDEFHRAEQRYRQYSTASLCLAWVPIIGDPLTVMAGIFRTPLVWFIVIVTAVKCLRYLLLTYFIVGF